MADVTTVDTHVQSSPILLALRIEAQDRNLRAADAAELLQCLSELAGLIAGSDYVELAEADPVDAEKWKSLSLVIKEISGVDPWELVTVLPGCTPEKAQAFVDALTAISALVQDRKGDRKPDDEDALIDTAAHLLVQGSKDVPRTAPVEDVRDVVLRLSALSLTINQVAILRR
jgi:hypothetical protein